MSTTKNVGQVAGLFIGTSAPQNTTLIWFDSTTNQRCHKVFDPQTGLWKVLEPGIVALTTYSELVNNAKKNGLSIGKFYQITDKSNALAIAIGTTKVQYSDSLGNILVDDLGTNVQYHASSGNILIDGIGGVFNTDTNKLVFSFEEQTPDSDNYVLGKKLNNSKWKLFKFKISSLISSASGNSITWNKGFFFDFSNSIKNILNKVGGIVGYDDYNKKVEAIETQINQVSKNNQTIIQNANNKISSETSDDAIFNKKIPKRIDVSVAPGDVLANDTLYTIVSKFQRWLNKFKFATGIRLSLGYADAKRLEYINNNDTVESALAKIQYFLKNPTTTGGLPSDWSTDAKPNDEGNNTAFFQDGYPTAGDSIFYAFAKIVDFLQNSTKAIELPSDWSTVGKPDEEGNPSSKTAFFQDGYPIVGDSIFYAFAKIVDFLQQSTKAIKLPSDWSTDAEGEVSAPPYTAFFRDGYPKSGDSIFYAFAKIVDFLRQSGKTVKLSSDWTEMDYTYDTPRPVAGDTLDSLVKKVVAILSKVKISYNKISATDDSGKEGVLDFQGNTFQIAETAVDNNGIVSTAFMDKVSSNITIPNSASTWNTITTAHSFNLTAGSTYSAALSAKNNANGSLAFDAAFNRLLVGRLVMNYISVGAGSYTVNDKCFIINNTPSTTADVYLPNNPCPGTIIFMCPSNKDSAINVHAGGSNGFDQIGSSVANLTLNNRGVTFFFAWTMPGVSYESSAEIVGLWSWGKFGH